MDSRWLINPRLNISGFLDLLKANFRANLTVKKKESQVPNGLRKRIGETENRHRQRKLLNMEDSVKKKA